MTSETPAETGRKYRKGAARRAEILAKAIGLFAEHGVEASLRAIGDAIGVSHAALRYYFASRDELLVEVYRTHEAAPESGPIPETASAVGVMELSAENNRTIPGLIELYATLTTDALQAQRHPLTRDFIRSRFRRVRSDLAERIRSDQRAGIIDESIDPDDAAALVAAASDGLQLQWLLHPDEVDIRRSLKLLERILPAGPKGR
ncbi:MAG: helix-turn-helix domain-containing protein [Pseudolysinimonas sp.]